MLKGRSLLTLLDYSESEILYLLDLADALKQKKRAATFDLRLKNKNIALVFEKLSTRTRCAFTVACADEGARAEFLSPSDIHLGVKESVEDTARVLGRMFDGIAFRGFAQETVEKLAQYSGVPVWNALTDFDHPTQALADLMTIREKFGRLKGINLTYVGDGRNNVANALMIACAKTGVNFTIATPAELFPDERLTAKCAQYARESGAFIHVLQDAQKAAHGANAVYTDVWVSMGEEAQTDERKRLLAPYQVNAALMAATVEDCVFMHCLPAVKGQEVTADVFESPSSVVFEQAENRLHTIKSVMAATL